MPILFHTHKLNHYQIKYPTTNKELLSIVNTLLEFKTLLYSTKIIIHTDYKNLMHENTLHISARGQYYRLILENFGCELLHILEEDNIMADTLSRLGVIRTDLLELEDESYHIHKVHEDNVEIPIKLEVSRKYQ